MCIYRHSICVLVRIFFFKQKTAYEMRISDWSSDVCSSDLRLAQAAVGRQARADGDGPELVEVVELARRHGLAHRDQVGELDHLPGIAAHEDRGEDRKSVV